MRKLRHILCQAFVILGLLSSMVPIAPLGDANRDSRVDLVDAVLYVMQLAGSAEQPNLFTESAKNAISAMNTVAGLATVICPDGELATGPTAAGLDPPLLLVKAQAVPFEGTSYPVDEITVDFVSVILDLPTPPPKSV